MVREAGGGGQLFFSDLKLVFAHFGSFFLTRVGGPPSSDSVVVEHPRLGPSGGLGTTCSVPNLTAI